MKKITSTLLSVLMVTTMIITSIINVKATSETIQLGDAYKTKSYIAGVSFSYKVTTNGNYLYCLNMHKKTAENVEAKLVKNSKYINGGLVHILKNGYPEKSITGDKDKDYYITQTAVWWYLDKTTGSSNLGEQFKSEGSDSYGLRKYVKQLVNEGYSHRNDSLATESSSLEIKAINGNEMTLKDKYYISNDIKASSIKNISSYNVSLKNAPKGTVIVSSNGSEATYQNSFKVNANDSFRVKIPAESISATNLSITVSANADSNTQYVAHEYKPVNSEMQTVALLEKASKNVSSETTLEVASSKLTVVKVDANTKEAIAGAKLVLKDETGKEITSWTSTINAHIIRNLANGTYTIEETSAPTGYQVNKNETKFTLSDSNRDVKVTIENAPKKVVVNITKVDQETNSPLAGAILVVKDSAGTEIARFTTTEEAYVLTDLKNGTYTVEEVSAPSGYIKSTEAIPFTIDDEHLSHQITFINAKEVVVPDTASVSSIFIAILGIVITGVGIDYIVKNAKRV